LNQGSFQEDILDWVYNTTRQSVEKYQLTSGIDGVFEIKDMADFYKTKQGDQYGLFYKDLTNPATGLCSPLFFFVFFFLIIFCHLGKTVRVKDIEAKVFISLVIGDVLVQKSGPAVAISPYSIDVTEGLNGKIVIDNSKSGNETRYVNHSHLPNVSYQRLKMKSYRGFLPCLVSTCRIRSGDQLTVDYGYQYSSLEEVDLGICCCGAPCCQRVIGSRVPPIIPEKSLLPSTTSSPSSNTGLYFSEYIKLTYPLPMLLLSILGNLR
jgi:hypothetical protein